MVEMGVFISPTEREGLVKEPVELLHCIPGLLSFLFPDQYRKVLPAVDVRGRMLL